jgi:hypothetical protein
MKKKQLKMLNIKKDCIVLLILLFFNYLVEANLSDHENRLVYDGLIDEKDIDYNKIEKRQMNPSPQSPMMQNEQPNDQPSDNNLQQENNPEIDDGLENSAGSSGGSLNLPSRRPNCLRKKS